MQIRLSILLLILTFIFLSFSAESCESYQVTSNQPGTDYRSIAYKDAIDAGIPPNYFVTQIQVESGFNPSVLSPAGAEGIAQIMPSTAQAWNVNPWDPDASLSVASQHMAWYQNTYGSYEKALSCYNAGCDALVWAEHHCEVFYWCLPSETRHYITAITGYVP